MRERVRFTARLEADALLKGRALFDHGWTVTLFVTVAPGFELPVYLVTAGASAL